MPRQSMHPRGETITSPANPWLKQLRRAASRGTAVADGLALAESPHLLHEALRSGIEIERVFASERMVAEIEAVLPAHRRIPLHPVANRLFDQVATTSRSQGVLALVRLRAWDPDSVLDGLTLALDGVQDPGNAGTIVRSAEAFGASGVVFLKGSAAPTNPKALRASAGSLFRLPFLQKIGADEFLDLARSRGKTLYCGDAREGIPLFESGLSKDCAIVIGSETHGVNPALAKAATAIAIPTESVDSLNASIAASIMLYEYARRPRSQ